VTSIGAFIIIIIMVVIKACLGGVLIWTAFALTYKKALRVATGWEDPTTKAFE